MKPEIFQKPKKAVIINCPYSSNTDSPSLGLGYLNSSLRKHGFQTTIIDANIELFSRHKRKFGKILHENELLTWDQKKDFYKIIYDQNRNFNYQIIKKIRENNPDVICFSIHRSNLLYTNEIIKEIRKVNHEVFVVCGGPSTKLVTEIRHMQHENVNLFIDTNDLDKTALRLREILENKKVEDVKVIEGMRILSIKNNHNYLNKRPFPDFEGFELNKYGQKKIPFITSEGCIRKCRFCDEYQYRETFISRKGKNTAEEIKSHVKNYGVQVFEQNDLACNSNIKELKNFCDEVIRKNLDISWSSNALIRKEMTKELLTKMKSAGCNWLRYGLESGCNKTLTNMRKGFTKKTAEEVIRNTHRAKIGAHINIIVGFPEETEEDFQETLDFLSRNKQHISNVSNVFTYMLSPNSDIIKHKKKYGITFPDNENGFFLWKDDQGNNYELREKRLKRTMNFLKKENINHAGINAVNNKDVLIHDGRQDNKVLYPIMTIINKLNKATKYVSERL